MTTCTAPTPEQIAHAHALAQQGEALAFALRKDFYGRWLTKTQILAEENPQVQIDFERLKEDRGYADRVGNILGCTYNSTVVYRPKTFAEFYDVNFHHRMFPGQDISVYYDTASGTKGSASIPREKFFKVQHNLYYARLLRFEDTSGVYSLALTAFAQEFTRRSLVRTLTQQELLALNKARVEGKTIQVLTYSDAGPSAG